MDSSQSQPKRRKTSRSRTEDDQPRQDISVRVREEIKLARRNGAKALSLWRRDLTEVPEEIWTLPLLERLYLTGNQLQTVPARLWELPHLRLVDLCDNPIARLPDLPGLGIDEDTYLRCRGQFSPTNVSKIQIAGVIDPDGTDWVRDLGLCTNLRELVVGSHNLVIGREYPEPSSTILRILEAVGEFQSLESFSLRALTLPVLPDTVESLRMLRNLTDLDLSGLQLEILPEWIGSLSLESLWLIDNRLTSEVSVPLRNLNRLRNLSLAFNETLTAIPSAVFDLLELKFLDLTRCRIREIPSKILRLKHLQTLDVSESAIESPPEEIVTKGLDAIRDYWRQRQDVGVDYLCEAKLIVLGEPGAGKTSLARKIQNPSYRLREREPSTEGIDVIPYEFSTAVRTKDAADERLIDRTFQVNIWDFGGQEIYHATHQFFLTRRSVYVLVCDDRKEDTDFNYWLQVVEMLTDASPLLIVQNEKQDRARDINLSELRSQFENLRGAISTNLDDNRGLDTVIRSIRRELESLPHIGIGLPATWKRVREALEQNRRDYIGLHDYLDLCQQHGFTRREDKMQLSGFLHDLGICLHFQDDEILRNTVILKPTWGTDAVYRVLDDRVVSAAQGRFSMRDLSRIWSEPKYAGMHSELLRLMMNFQLCYPLEGGQSFVAPQLLSSAKPDYTWDAVGGLTLRYQYAFMPKGMLARFIVATNYLIEDDRLAWKTGVILRKRESRAEVIEDYRQRMIRVRVSGPDPRGLLAIVDDHLERIHRSFPRLKYDRYLPCPCDECAASADPYAFPAAKLQAMAAKRQRIQCYSSGEMVDACALIRDVLPGALGPDSLKAEPLVSAPAQRAPEVFVSYAWTDESFAIASQLRAALEEQGVRLLMDREEVRYKDSIREFMRRLGRGNAVVALISEKYLKSENCMFELLEIAAAGALRDRIFPIVLADANIYKATGRAGYVGYWEQQIKELDEALKSLRGDSLTNLQEDLNTYAEIRRSFDRITATLRDMNALTPDEHEGTRFEELIKRIRALLK